MPNAVLGSIAGYERATTNAIPAQISHNLSNMFGGSDLWGHWSVRVSARRIGTTITRHWRQDVTGIWTAGTGLILPTPQESASIQGTDASIVAAGVSVTSGFDDLAIALTGVAATNLNWYVTVETINPYTEA